MSDEAKIHGHEDGAPLQGGGASLSRDADEVEWNMADTVRAVARKRRVLLLYSIGGVLFGILIALVWPSWYEAQAVFLPPSLESSLPSAAGGGAAASLQLLRQDPSDMYLGMLGSRSVADDVIDQAGLMTVYRAKTRTAARSMLQSSSKFLVTKNSLISVTITAREPKLAADIANAYLEALYHLNGTMVSSAADHRRVFFEEQMESARKDLSDAEDKLQKVEVTTGIVLPEGAAQAGLRATAELQAQIGAAQTRLSGLAVGATDQNSRVIQAKAELAELKAQLAQQQQADSKTKSSGAGLASSAELPRLALENLRQLREVKLRETIYDALTQQFEKARIGSLDPGPEFQIVDRAVVPEQKAGPPRKLIVAGSAVLGFLAGLFYILLGDSLRKIAAMFRDDSAAAAGRS